MAFHPALLCGGVSADRHQGVGWVPSEILERPVALRSGIGNLHQAVTTSSPEAQKFYDQGLDYLHAFVWIEAARSFHQALRLDPSMAMAYEGLGDDYVALSDNVAARNALEKAQSLADKVTSGERARIEILAAQLDYLDDPSADMRKYFAIRKMIGDALTASPRDPWLWILRGFADEGSAAAHGQDGGIDTVAFYQTALALSPDNSAAHHYLAHTFENLGRSEQALEEASAFERLAPAIPHAHHMRGHELRMLGRTQEAIVEFQKADELENSYYKAENIPAGLDWHHAHNLDLLALSYESLGQVKAAEPLLREAVSEPAHTDIAEFNWRELPDFLLDRGRPDDALKAAREIIARSSWPMGRFGGHAEAGEALVALGRLDDAKNELQLAESEMEHVPLSALSVLPQAKVLQAEISLSEGDFTQAETILKQIEQRILAMSGPDSWMDTLFELQSIAQVARGAGDWDLSEFTAQQMVAHDPSYAGGYFALGLAEQHRGDESAALTQFKMAEKLWANADADLPELKQVRDKLGAQP
jgi:tetratricopeptide (TPR) repeat protein